MDTLKKMFADTEAYVKQLAQKLSEHFLLTEQDCLEAMRLMNGTRQEQERCIGMLKEAGDGESEYKNIGKLEELAEALARKQERQERMGRLRDMVAKFLSIHTDLEECRVELARIQETLASCGEEALVRMEEEGGLEPYRKFIDCVKAEQPDMGVVHSLAGTFGRPLAFALLYHELKLTEQADGKEAQVPPSEKATEGTAAPKEAEEASLLEPIRPLNKGNAKQKTLKDGLRGVKQEAKAVFVLVRQFAVLSAELLVGLSMADLWMSLSSSDSSLCREMVEDSLRLLTERGLVAGYRTKEYGELYCLTEYGQRLFFLKEKEGALELPQGKHRRFVVTSGNRKVIAASQMEGGVLKSVFQKNQDMMRYLNCILDKKQKLHLEREGLNEIRASFCWEKDHYVVKVPLQEAKVLCHVCHSIPDAPETGAVLFLTAMAPEGSFEGREDMVFFCNGQDCYTWKQDWVSITGGAPLEEALTRAEETKEKDAEPETKEEPEGKGAKPKAKGKTGKKNAGQALKKQPDEKGDGRTTGEEPAGESTGQTEETEFGKTAIKQTDEKESPELPQEQEPEPKTKKKSGETAQAAKKETEKAAKKETAGKTKKADGKDAAKRKKTKGKESTDKEAKVQKKAGEEVAGTLEAEAGEPPQTLNAQESARHLLGVHGQIRMEQLLRLTVQLISENRIAEAAALAETLAKAPNAGKGIESFYRAFRQCVQVPGSVYHYGSEAIGEQQIALPEDDLELRGLQQTMILSTLLWAMAFPSVAYDHNLYNHVKMVVGVDESQPVQELITLLSEDLKAVSFQNDGLGFSPLVISSLVNNGERERQMTELEQKAAQLRPTPTSTVGITGLETCLKQMVGPTSAIGTVLLWIEKNEPEKMVEAGEILKKELGEDYLNSDERLEQYIDRCWSELYRSDARVKVKRLENDTTARKQCKKALTDRLKLIESWFGIVQSERESKFGQYKEHYARIFNQVKTSLNSLISLTGPDSGRGIYKRAGENILHRTAEKMLAALDGTPWDSDEGFYYSLCLTPELMLGINGENIVISELYGVAGMEPWSFVLRAVAAEPEKPEEILEQIDNYQAPRWYRNYGSEVLLSAYTGKECPDRAQGIQNAQRDAEQSIQTFQSNARLNRAYGKIQESTMETAFSVLDIIKQFFFRMHNYASFKNFLARLETQLANETKEREEQYERRVKELEGDEQFAGAPIWEVIHQALANKNFNSLDSYINQLQSGIRDLPISEKAMAKEENFLIQFQKCEKGYYDECQSLHHRSKNPARWGEQALESMGKEYQHWTSVNEKKKGFTWLSNWILGKDDKNTGAKVRSLLTGLGFRVKDVVQDEDIKPMSMYELFLVNAEKTSAGLKDYPHPIYKFGTELSNPMYVVCLYGCKGESTLINVMTSELQLNGPTIVLMDGSLTVPGRRLVAKKFKADTSGQSPFLLIDRVLLLYLASLNEGDRQNAMLHCTLPYTFEVLYGNGSGAVPEEMFIGRGREMNDLRNEQGPNLVYGGRQLGKTALLNRASKTINDPKNKDYSFCVDVKDEGSAVLLEKMNRQLQKLKILEQGCASLKVMCEMLQEAYEDGKIRRLQVFVDEADQMFEEFRQNDYEALRPFIVMRDATKQHVKFVFAGTHNVAATESVELKNSSLLHMGTPLCIEPLSYNDAMKLIRIPMSYLGFEIGDSQIELILSNTNNYPGLIHIFCNALIQSVCRDYEIYYNNSKADENPPYRISDEQMRAVFKEKDIRREIGTRVMSTIKLNRKYHVISCVLANMLYEDRENEHNRLYGYGAGELLDYNRRELQLPLLTKMAQKDLDALLDEMVKMGILWKNKETGQFRFRQQDFLNYIGTNEQVLGFLLSEGMEGENQ